MISNFKDFNKELHDYVSGKFTLTPIQNILMNDYTKEWYSLIGKYFLEQWGEENLAEHKILLDRLKTGSRKDKETSYRMLGIYFITSHLNEKTLKDMFGKPICHSEFGEGFDKRRKYEYCSYFLNIDGHKSHIGYDHRGTSIEVENGLKPEEVFNMIKELVDKFANIFVGSSNEYNKVVDILKETIFDEQRPKPSTISVYDALSDKADKLINKLINKFCNDGDIESFINSIDLKLGISSKTEKELLGRLSN